jgi:hypothetical protein
VSTPLNVLKGSGFRALVAAGERLAELHVNYESQPQYPLKRIWVGERNFRVERMRLSKDRTRLVYNKSLTLAGIPPETYNYRLGNRSALEWVVDQYQLTTDRRSGITNDPNRADDPEYIVRLVGQVVYVSVETVKIQQFIASIPLWEGMPPLASAVRPCPYCGSGAEVCYLGDGHSKPYAVECKRCLACGPFEIDAFRATMKWNAAAPGGD